MGHNLEGNIVIITGAGGRLGRRMVEGFVQHGATVAVVDRHPEPMAFAEQVPCQTYSADLTSEASVAACFRKIVDACGHADVLVHTVGAWAGQPFLDTSLDDWDRLLRVNLTSAFLCFREAARLMQGRGGRLIGIASGQGADQGRAQQGAYSASKAGVVRLVEAVAEEFEGTGITAHAIAPSFVLFDEESDDKGVPVRDLVELALYLCTPAGRSLNGATLRTYGTLR